MRPSRPAAATLRRPRPNMSSLRSMPVIRASVRSASSRATPAGPVATSRTAAGVGHGHVVDHLPPPPPVLAQGEHGGQAVVASGQTGEQRPGEGRRRGSSGSSVHLAPFGWGTLYASFPGGVVASPTVDAVVVGAGPAGSTAAHRAGPGRCPGGAGRQGDVRPGQGVRRPRGTPGAGVAGVAGPVTARAVGRWERWWWSARPGGGCFSRPEQGAPTRTTAWPSPACASTPGCATPPSPPARNR